MLPLKLLGTVMVSFGKQFESNWILLNLQAMVSVTVESVNVTKDGLGTLASTQLTVTWQRKKVTKCAKILKISSALMQVRIPSYENYYVK